MFLPSARDNKLIGSYKSSSASSDSFSEEKRDRETSVFSRKSIEEGRMSWQTYVDDHLMCEIDGQRLTAAAILGHDGSVWAVSASFPQVSDPPHSLRVLLIFPSTFGLALFSCLCMLDRDRIGSFLAAVFDASDRSDGRSIHNWGFTRFMDSPF